ncbi:unnamed protein product [Rotaria sp. Silwood1]|nr:unnamed protein product [Rotaria sp. Silwood1]
MTSRSLMIITFVLLSIYSWCATSVVATNLYPANLDGLKNQFQTAMKSFSDVASLHYSLAGIKELGVQPPDTFCNDIKKLVDKSNIESIYHATEAAKVLTNCKLSVDDYRSKITSTIQSDKSTTAEIYYAVCSSVNLGLNIDESTIEKRLNTLSKTDDSILSQGYALLTGAQLSPINDLVQQADEIDGRILQYEGGISTTTLVFNAFYEVAEKAGASIKIDPKQLIKFANYFSTKRHVATLRSAYYLTKAFKHLSDNKNSMPIVVSRVSSSEVNQQNPSVLVSVTNLFGQPVGEMTVTADSAKRNEDGVVVISKQKLTPKASDFQGEYVAPEKIEDVYARSRFISQIFVYGDSFESFLVAIVLLNDDYVKQWAKNEGYNVETPMSSELNAKLKQTVLDDMIREGKKRGLMSYEQVKAIEFIKESFTIENGLLTPTLKARRYAVEKKYKELFQKIYQNTRA